MSKDYAVYFMANQNNSTIYVGVTNNLIRRVSEHKNGNGSGFTAKYKLHKLVYYETYNEIDAAIVREKQIKAGSRKKKEELVNSLNPGWKDMFEGLF
jgi:putative endonuclease